MAIPGGMIDRAIQQRKQAPGYNPNILGAFGQLMTGVGNLIQGRPYMSGARVGQPGQYYGPGYASNEALGIQPGGLRNYGANYKEKELAAGAAAEAFRPGAGFPGQQAAADRAYQQEVSRVAQMTAQDPELQRYEKARASAKTQEEMNAARDIGMQMWAKANPQLAAKVRPGQSGYDVIQGTLAGQAAAQGYGYQMPQQIMMTPPPGVNSPQGLPTVQSFGPSATYGAQGLEIDPEMAKKFQALINQPKG